MIRFFAFVGLLTLVIVGPAFATMHGSGTIPFFIDPANSNVSIGQGTLGNVTTGNHNVCVGFNTCSGMTTAIGNVVLNYGESALVTGINNVIIGQSDVVGGSTGATSNAVLVGNTVGNSYDVAIGYNVMANITTGFGQNVAIGASALYQNTTGFNNTVVGMGVGSQCGTGGAAPCTYDVFMGFNAGSGQTSTTRNVVIGPNVGSSGGATGTNNILIGTDSAINVTATAASNEIHIGGSGGDWVKVTGTNTQSTQSTTHYGVALFPNITTDATHTDSSVCQDSTTHQIYFGSGVAGICLGTSSARYKHNIEVMVSGIAQVEQLKPVTFYYKNGFGDGGAKKQEGFIAEDVVKVLPDLVGLDKDGKPNSVDMMGMVPVLVKAMQDQQKQIDHIREGRDGYRCYGIFWCKD